MDHERRIAPRAGQPSPPPASSLPARLTRSAALALLAVTATLWLSTPGFASFETHLVQIGPGGVDSSIDDVAEALSLSEGDFTNYQILVDTTALRSVIDLGTEGDFGIDLTYPDGSVGDSTGGPFTKEQFVVRVRAGVTIPAGAWTIAFGSDEGGRLALPGIVFASEIDTLGDAGLDDTLVYDGPRTHAQTLGQFVLATPTFIPLDGLFFEGTGADSYEISIANGTFAAHNTVDFQPLEDGVFGIEVSPSPAAVLASDGLANDAFGFSVAIDGDTAVVGAYLDDDGLNESGSAYVFERSGSTWVQRAKLRAGDATANDRFGFSVAISGDTIVVGASRKPTNFTGAAYVFVEPAGGWAGTLTHQAKLGASDAAASSDFGHSVAIASDLSGDVVVVGSPVHDGLASNAGQAYLFVEPVGGWTGTLTEDARLSPTDLLASDNFGVSVAVSGDTVVVGSKFHDAAAFNAGAAYVFVEPGGGWTAAGLLNEEAKLSASDAFVGDQFGFSVAISDETIVAGATMDDDAGAQSGSAYVFSKPGSGWSGTLTENAKLLSSDGAAGDNLGHALSIAGKTIVAGAPFKDGAVADLGAAYVFVEGGAGWTGTLFEDRKLAAVSGLAGDDFGFAVSVANDTAIVGAPETLTGRVGKAFVYRLEDTNVDLCASVDCSPFDDVCSLSVCNPATGLCDLSDPRPAGTLCRAGSGDACDPDEFCNGVDDFCPVDLFEPATTVCNPGSGDLCDPDEMCLGIAGAACPADSIAAAGTVCLVGSGDLCDPDEVCTGIADAACPADLFEPASTVCNPGSGDLCDPDEMCLGIAGAACPVDSITAAGTVCLVGSGDLCDPDEVCTGIADAACPADVFEPASTVCNPGSGDLCDPDEMCLGIAGAACPADSIADSTTLCNPSSTGDEICDPSEFCTGLADAACPTDSIAPVGAACGDPSLTACTLPDSCDGAGLCLLNNQACGMLSDQSLCTFDVAPDKGICVLESGAPTGETCNLSLATCTAGTCQATAGSTFELVFTPDEQNVPSFELSSSQPRHFFYNVFYDGPFPASLSITIPYPFVTQGTRPVHIYDGALVAAEDSCLIQPDPIAFDTQQITMADYLGLGVDPEVTCDLVCDPSGATAALGTCFGGSLDGSACEVGDAGDACVVAGGGCAPSGSCSFDVEVDDPGSGLAYINVLLDYGLEGRNTDANPCADGLVDRYEQGAFDLASRGWDALTSVATGPGSLGIASCTDYRFAHTDGTATHADTVQNRNAFLYSQEEIVVSYAVEGGQPSSLTYAGGATTVRPADALELATAALVFAAIPDVPLEDVDALHVRPDGRIVFSTSTDFTQPFGGLASFRNGDLVEWDPVSGTASVVFEADRFDALRNIDAVTMLPNGNWLLSTSLTATLGGLTFENADIVEYDPITDTASLYMGLSEAFLFTGSNPDIDGLHRLDDGSLLISVRTAGVGTIGSNFGFVSADRSDSDIFVYDPATDLAMRYLEGENLFDDPDGAGPLTATRNLDGLFVPEPDFGRPLWIAALALVWLAGLWSRRAGSPQARR